MTVEGAVPPEASKPVERAVLGQKQRSQLRGLKPDPSAAATQTTIVQDGEREAAFEGFAAPDAAAPSAGGQAFEGAPRAAGAPCPESPPAAPARTSPARGKGRRKAAVPPPGESAFRARFPRTCNPAVPEPKDEPLPAWVLKSRKKKKRKGGEEGRSSLRASGGVRKSRGSGGGGAAAKGRSRGDGQESAAERSGSEPVKRRGRRSGPHPCADVLYGCSKCRYQSKGCTTCRDTPAFARPPLRWRPEAGRPQPAAAEAPTFYPTEEEFEDPVAYISSLLERAAPYGLAHIVPPEGWSPPFALERGTNGQSMESFRFAIRKQLTSALCRRSAPKGGEARGGGGRRAEGGRAQGGRMTGRMGGGMDGRAGEGRPAGEGGRSEREAAPGAKAEPTEAEARPAEADETPRRHGPPIPRRPAPVPSSLAEAQPCRPERSAAVGGRQTQPAPGDTESEASDSDVDEFGFLTLEKTHTLRSFATYADWARARHFSDPAPRAGSGTPPPEAERRPKGLRPLAADGPPPPSLEELEAEFWRVVEDPQADVESLYGQDLDSGHHGSGFPLPQWRRALLGRELAARAARRASRARSRARGAGKSHKSNKSASKAVQQASLAEQVTRPPTTPLEAHYAGHPWNVNNMPRGPGSVLSRLPGQRELITGVMVPWLYVGSAMSAFCWHVEDHALYSVNYHHLGAPKVWYGAGPHAARALEAAVSDALPHLAADPHLMFQLVTMLSPEELGRRGVPVCRVVQRPGQFVVTMPNSYHGGFNAGFNVAEAVNFAPPNWIPYGSDVVAKYRAARKPCTFSHDMLLHSLVQAGGELDGGIAGADGNDGDGSPREAAQNQAPLGPRVRRATAKAADRHGQASAPPPPVASLDARQAGHLRRAARLAAGELALRAGEERRRLAAGLESLGLACWPSSPQRVEAGLAPATRDPDTQVLRDTADCDCAECACDLWLSAVVSAEAPDAAVCPEHAAWLVSRGASPCSLRLMQRHAPEDLERALDDAFAPGHAAAAAEARRALEKRRAEEIEARPTGPLYPVQPDGSVPPLPRLAGMEPRRRRRRRRRSKAAVEVREEEAREEMPENGERSCSGSLSSRVSEASSSGDSQSEDTAASESLGSDTASSRRSSDDEDASSPDEEEAHLRPDIRPTAGRRSEAAAETDAPSSHHATHSPSP